jgi:phytol kinase
MSSNDLYGLIYSYLYAGGLLAAGEILHRVFGIAQQITRKIVHIGAGLWIWAILILFDSWLISLIPFASFILFNWLLYRFRLLGGVDEEESSPGTVYFAVSITVLFGLFWRGPGNSPDILMVMLPLMMMTIGDAAASLVGFAWGRHAYQLMNHRRSLEGSLAFFVFALLANLLTLHFLPAFGLAAVPLSLSRHILLAGFATAVESVSPFGLDNMFVPLGSAFFLYLLL